MPSLLEVRDLCLAAQAELDKGALPQALATAEKAVEVAESGLSPGHYGRAMAGVILAQAALELKDTARALEVTQATKRRAMELGELDFEHKIAILKQLIVLFVRLDAPVPAQQLANKTLNLLVSSYGPGHPLTALTRVELSRWLPN